MTWCIGYRCDDCGLYSQYEENEFSLGNATPFGWTGFGNGYVYRTIYCQTCSNKLAEEGRKWLEEQIEVGEHGNWFRKISRVIEGARRTSRPEAS